MASPPCPYCFPRDEKEPWEMYPGVRCPDDPYEHGKQIKPDKNLKQLGDPDAERKPNGS